VAEDVAVAKATIGRVSSPVVLVGHSYGGSVITALELTTVSWVWFTSLRSLRTPTRHLKHTS
jgi:hypothetical protein